ncbi:MAG: hypothetical protein JNK05_25040 [Myxococcales bacterium]|nr:hypothetical protein [Myxococcales bacterium]
MAPTIASAQQRGDPPCSRRRLDFVETCLGHVLVRAVGASHEVSLDGTVLGSTPLLISADADRAHTIELRSTSGSVQRRTMSLARGRLIELDARLRSRRATSASIASLSWARFASFDRCDGYSLSDTPFVRPMNSSEFAQFRRRR